MFVPVVPFVAAVAADCCCCCCCGSNMIKTCRGFCHHVQPPEFLGGSVTIMGYPFGESQTWYNIYIYIYINYIYTYFMLTIKNWFTFDLCNLKNHNEITIKWFRSVCCLGNPIDVWPHPINFSAKMQPTERLRRPIAGLKWSQPTHQSAFQNYNHDYTLTWQWKIPKINLIEATNPNACFKKSRRRRVPTDQWKANRRCSIA